MLRRLAVGMSVTVLVTLVATVSNTGAARAAEACTGWTSDLTPPPTIRVLRTTGPVPGAVETVDFRSYVEDVLSHEFGAHNPRAAVLAGAIFVKQYAWYHAMHWRGKSAGGMCYDVVDSSRDQVYRPDRGTPDARHLAAVADTWPVTLRKNGRFFPTGYRQGDAVACGADADGWHLFQRSAYKCGSAGMSMETILRAYLEPGLSIVDPGAGDVTGDGLGDVSVVLGLSGASIADAEASPSGGVVVRVYEAGGVEPPAPPPTATPSLSPAPSPTPPPTPSPTPRPPLAPITLPVDPASVLGTGVGDVTGDRLADLVLLQRTGTDAFTLSVAVAEQDQAFGPPGPWWSSDGTSFRLPSGTLVSVVVADFDGDGRADAGLFARLPAGSDVPAAAAGAIRPTGEQGKLYVLLSTAASFGPPTSWLGPVPLNQGAAVVAADVTGDGEADLVLQEDLLSEADPTGALGPVGYRFSVARSRTGGGLDPLEPWSDVEGVAGADTQLEAADVDRDGRADIVLGHAMATGGARLLGLMSTGSEFAQKTLWSASRGYTWSAAKMAAADVNGDGRGDIVILYNYGSSGTRLYRYLSNGSALKTSTRSLDPTLPWGPARPL
jgi:hypothetical protein